MSNTRVWSRREEKFLTDHKSKSIWMAEGWARLFANRNKEHYPRIIQFKLSGGLDVT